MLNEKTWTIDYKTTILKVIKLIITRAQKVHILKGHTILWLGSWFWVVIFINSKSGSKSWDRDFDNISIHIEQCEVWTTCKWNKGGEVLLVKVQTLGQGVFGGKFGIWECQTSIKCLIGMLAMAFS